MTYLLFLSLLVGLISGYLYGKNKKKDFKTETGIFVVPAGAHYIRVRMVGSADEDKSLIIGAGGTGGSAGSGGDAIYDSLGGSIAIAGEGGRGGNASVNGQNSIAIGGRGGSSK